MDEERLIRELIAVLEKRKKKGNFEGLTSRDAQDFLRIVADVGVTIKQTHCASMKENNKLIALGVARAIILSRGGTL